MLLWWGVVVYSRYVVGCCVEDPLCGGVCEVYAAEYAETSGCLCHLNLTSGLKVDIGRGLSCRCKNTSTNELCKDADYDLAGTRSVMLCSKSSRMA